MVICSVINCAMRSNRDHLNGIRFFCVPKVITYQCELTRARTERRRALWLARINRKDLHEENVKVYTRVCSRHFVSGSPAAIYDETNPDWAPSLHLGYKLNCMPDAGRYQRLLERKMRTRTVFSSCASENADKKVEYCENINISKAMQSSTRRNTKDVANILSDDETSANSDFANEKVECYENINISNAVQDSTQERTKDVADILRDNEISASSKLTLTCSDVYALDINVDKDTSTENSSIYHKICRLCAQLVNEFQLTSLFPSDGSRDLVNKINILLPEKVLKGDGLPEHVCNSCIIKLNECDSTVKAFIAAAEELKSLFELKCVLPNIQNQESKRIDCKNKYKSTQTVICALENPRYTVVHAEIMTAKEEELSLNSSDVTLRHKNDTCLDESISPTTSKMDDYGEENGTYLIKEETKLFEVDDSQLNWPSQAPVDMTYEVENARLESEYLCVPSEATNNRKAKKRNKEEIETKCDFQAISKKIKIDSPVCEKQVKSKETHPSASVSYVPVNENQTRTADMKCGTNVPNVIPQVRVYSRRKK